MPNDPIERALDSLFDKIGDMLGFSGSDAALALLILIATLSYFSVYLYRRTHHH